MTGSALGKRNRNESETAVAVFSKKRWTSVASETKVSLFVVIPREIRDMIVGNLLRAGDVNILQVSKALSEEASERINQEATCRIYYGCPNHANSKFSRPANPARIRNVEIRFHMSEQMCRNPPIMSQFREDCAIFRLDEVNTALKSTCDLTLEYGQVGLGRRTHEMRRLFLEALRPLTGFENVVLRVVPEKPGSDRFSGPGMQAFNERALTPDMEHFLGAMTIVGEGEGRRMVFHPRHLNTVFSLANEMRLMMKA